MLANYFEVGLEIETQLRNELGNDVGLICSPFTANDPNELKKQTVSLHIAPLPSQFGNFSGSGAKQSETQQWQIALCYQSPKTAAEEHIMRQNAGVLLLRLRLCIQGFCPQNAKPLQVIANQFYMTDDCRFRIFAFTAASVVVI